MGSESTSPFYLIGDYHHRSRLHEIKPLKHTHTRFDQLLHHSSTISSTYSSRYTNNHLQRVQNPTDLTWRSDIIFKTPLNPSSKSIHLCRSTNTTNPDPFPLQFARVTTAPPTSNQPTRFPPALANLANNPRRLHPKVPLIRLNLTYTFSLPKATAIARHDGVAVLFEPTNGGRTSDLIGITPYCIKGRGIKCGEYFLRLAMVEICAGRDGYHRAKVCWLGRVRATYTVQGIKTQRSATMAF